VVVSAHYTLLVFGTVDADGEAQSRALWSDQRFEAWPG
jgi:hypothetical protein